MSEPHLPFGSAGFASRKECEAHGLLTDAPSALPFGQLVEGDKVGTRRRDAVGYGGERHGVILAPNGGGKTTRCNIPTLLSSDASRSFVVIDPKGELAATTAPWRRKCGEVYIINPCGVLADVPGYEDLSQSSGFNPMLSLDLNAPSIDADVSLFGEAFIPIEGNAPFFPKMARTLCSALIMWELKLAKDQGRPPSLGSVRNMLTNPEGLPKILAAMAASGHRGMANKAGPLMQEAKSVRDVISEFSGNIEWLDDQQIVDDLVKPGPDFGQLKKKAVTVYIILNAEFMSRYTKWLRLIISAALRACMRRRERGELPVTFLLEEYFLIANGGLRILEDNMAFVRGFGIQLVPTLQDLNQLQDLYPKRWQTFLGNAGVVAHVGPPNDLTTADWMSKRAGETTDFTQSLNNSGGATWSVDQEGTFRPGGSQGDGISYSQTRVPFLSIHDLFNTPEGRVYVWKQGLANTTLTHAPIYVDSPLGLKGRARANPYFLG